MVLVVLCSVAVLVAAGVLRLIGDARRKAGGCDAFFAELRASGAPEPITMVWSSSDDAQVRQLLETGER